MPEVELPVSDIIFFLYIISFQKLPPLTQGLEKKNHVKSENGKNLFE